MSSIAQIHAGRKDWRAALESIDRALAADGELPGLYAGKAEILLQARGARAARDWLEPALPRFPSSAQVQTAWAEILVELGERDAAVAALESVECLLSTGQANDVLASHRAGWRELKLEPLREKLGRRT
jgi:predicted Zn-dependent protease